MIVINGLAVQVVQVPSPRLRKVCSLCGIFVEDLNVECLQVRNREAVLVIEI